MSCVSSRTRLYNSRCQKCGIRRQEHTVKDNDCPTSWQLLCRKMSGMLNMAMLYFSPMLCFRCLVGEILHSVVALPNQ